MTLREYSTKIDLRLNKSASDDYDNIWVYQKKEALNKAITDWVRRQYRGKNQTQEGDEETTTRVDDLQILLKSDNITVREKDIFSETNKLPTDYLYFKRLTPRVSRGACSNIRMKSSLREEANVDSLVSLPSFDFEETFHTLIGNKIRIYHFKRFHVDETELTYYRKPKKYTFKNLDEVIEFKDDICELFVAGAAKILAGDIESFNQYERNSQDEEINN